MKTNFLLIFFLSFGVVTTAQAKWYNLSRLQKERDVYVETLQENLHQRIEAIVPETHFILNTDVELKVIMEEQKQELTPEIYIGKLGVIKPPKPKVLPPIRVFRSTFGENIRKVNVNVILDETVPETKVVDIKQVVETMITEVSPNRIDLETKRMVIVGRKFWIVFQHNIDNFNAFLGRNRLISFIFLGLMVFFAGAYFVSRIVKKSTRTIGRAGDRILHFLENVHHNEVRSRGVTPTDLSSYKDRDSSHKDEYDKQKVELKAIKKELSYFIKSANERPIRLGLLLNQWIYDRPLNHEEGIALIPHIIDHDVFGQVMQNLSEDAKTKLSSIIGTNFSELESSKGKKFLQSHLPFMYQPDEEHGLESIVLSMTLEECVEAIKRDCDLGSLILHALPKAKSDKLLEKLPDVLMGHLIDSSLRTDVSVPAAQRRLKELVEAIREERAASIPPSFMGHIIQQLQSVSPERERGIFKMFRDNDRTEVLYTISKEVFPSELILKLPSSIIKLVLSSFSIESKARLILSIDQEEQEVLKTMIFEEGSREEQFLTMEMAKIKASPSLYTDVKEHSGEIWREFAQSVRRYLKTNKQAQRDANRVLENWIYTKRSETERAHLKKAA